MKRKVGRPKKTKEDTYPERATILLKKKEKEVLEKKAMETNTSVNKVLRDIVIEKKRKEKKK